MSSSSWFLYILRCSGGSLYTGITTDVPRRVAQHNAGRGAAYTRSHLPVTLVWSEKMASGTEARKREAEIKRWTKEKKETFCATLRACPSPTSGP